MDTPTIHQKNVSDSIVIRNTTLNDFYSINEIQNQAYIADFVEDISVLIQKFNLFPQGCFVALSHHVVIAYLTAYPICSTQIPLLNTHYSSEKQANALFIHDLVIHPHFQQLGLGSLLFAHFEAVALTTPYSEIYLISVQNSYSFWLKKGFTLFDASHLPPLNYGESAKIMRKLNEKTN